MPAPTTVAAGGATATTAPAAPTTVAAASGGSATVSVASKELSTFNPIGATDVAKLAKADVPAGARVSVTVDKASKKVCVVKGATVVALSAGKCKVKVAVASGKGKPKSKTTTITVKK
jgi:5-deoxy-D-glucuronate isomerase